MYSILLRLAPLQDTAHLESHSAEVANGPWEMALIIPAQKLTLKWIWLGPTFADSMRIPCPDVALLFLDRTACSDKELIGSPYVL